MIDLTLTGIPENQAILDELGGIDYLRPPMEESLALLHDPMARYPSQPSGKTYRRTAPYAIPWTSRITSTCTDIKGVLGNNARDKRGRAYGPYVGADPAGPERNQAFIHQGRWPHDAGVMRDNESEIRARFDRRLQNVANGER